MVACIFRCTIYDYSILVVYHLFYDVWCANRIQGAVSFTTGDLMFYDSMWLYMTTVYTILYDYILWLCMIPCDDVWLYMIPYDIMILYWYMITYIFNIYQLIYLTYCVSCIPGQPWICVFLCESWLLLEAPENAPGDSDNNFCDFYLQPSDFCSRQSERFMQIRVFDKFFSNRRVFHVGKNDMSKMMGPEMVNMVCSCILPYKKGLEWNNHTPHDGTASITLPCLGWIWPHCNLNSAVFGESSWNKVTMNSDGFIVKEFNRIHPDWCLQLVGGMKRWQ